MDIIPGAPVKLFNLPFEGYNLATLFNTWVVMAVLIAVAYVAGRSLRREPGRLQALLEMVAEFFDHICDSSLGEEHGRKYMAFITTLFLFVLLSNVIGTIPNFFSGLGWPGFYAPTQDLNTPLGLALLVLFVVHISAIRIKGFRAWLWSFYEPSFPADSKATKGIGAAFAVGAMLLCYLFISNYADALGALSTAKKVLLGALVGGFVVNCVLVTVYSFQLHRVPNAVMAPLNVVGELGKAISHPFRLFGNIFGGFVIVVVISHLIRHVGLPPFLNAFFGIFIGLVQAFVFAMLALAYTAVQIKD